jgi:hypothetical protein
MSSNNKIGDLARGCGPGGTAGELSRKKIDTVRPEPPSGVLAEAVKILRADRTGRWHVRSPEGARHRDGLYAWSISNREAERLLRLLWPNYVASRQRLADRLYGGEVRRVPASWLMLWKPRWIVKQRHAGTLRVAERNGNSSAGNPRSCAADGCRPSSGASLSGRSAIFG